MAKSIMQDKKDGQCYLCRLLHKDHGIKRDREEHHVLGGTANRKLSEKYGLKVYLDPDHHQYGPKAVHNNKEVALLLKREAQKAFMRAYPDLDFCEIFGKNYLALDAQPPLQDSAAAAGQGIQKIDGVSGMGTEWR